MLVTVADPDVRIMERTTDFRGRFNVPDGFAEEVVQFVVVDAALDPSMTVRRPDEYFDSESYLDRTEDTVVSSIERGYADGAIQETIAAEERGDNRAAVIDTLSERPIARTRLVGDSSVYVPTLDHVRERAVSTKHKIALGPGYGYTRARVAILQVADEFDSGPVFGLEPGSADEIASLLDQAEDEAPAQ